MTAQSMRDVKIELAQDLRRDAEKLRGTHSAISDRLISLSDAFLEGSRGSMSKEIRALTLVARETFGPQVGTPKSADAKEETPERIVSQALFGVTGVYQAIYAPQSRARHALRF